MNKPSLDIASLPGWSNPFICAINAIHGRRVANGGTHDYESLFSALRDSYGRLPVKFPGDRHVLEFMQANAPEVNAAPKHTVLAEAAVDEMALCGFSLGRIEKVASNELALGNMLFDSVMPVALGFPFDGILHYLSMLCKEESSPKHVIWFAYYHLLRLLALSTNARNETVINRAQRRLDALRPFCRELSLDIQ